MYDYHLYKQINSTILREKKIDITGDDNLFYTRLLANATAVHNLYRELYSEHPKTEQAFEMLLQTLVKGHLNRSEAFRKRDLEKSESGKWFLSNQIAGMSLYVDRFCGKINKLDEKLEYFERLGVNFLHLMPMFESPENESDGGYAVSNFRKIDKRFGTLKDLQNVQQQMQDKNMYLMLDIVMNHTSSHHEWAEKAKLGVADYQDYFYFFDDRNLPDQFDASMPEIFPESAPGNFTYVEECNKWVMTVFHKYQWDLNYRNPMVFVDMLDNVCFYANLGVDILRVDAPAFIWKQLGTSCQNLPEAHKLLRLLKLCIEITAPGMALLGEAIVAPHEIIKYFGTGEFTARECDFAYNATQMAVQWDALATGDTRVMMAAQHEILKKPFGTSWITYSRCHDDIGLAYSDDMIAQAGFTPYLHRSFLKNYFSGNFPSSPSKGALFSSNPKTGDARISGTLASLCGLENARNISSAADIELSIRKILLMQAQTFFIGGIPMLFYGDEVGYTNDYSYLHDDGKSYDNRWMHRPVINWGKVNKLEEKGSVEERIFSGTQKLILLRKKLSVFADHSNLNWVETNNHHLAIFTRTAGEKKVCCVFNFGIYATNVPWSVFNNIGFEGNLYDHLDDKYYPTGNDTELLSIAPYGFHVFEVI
jgi:amylosucrase